MKKFLYLFLISNIYIICLFFYFVHNQQKKTNVQQPLKDEFELRVATINIFNTNSQWKFRLEKLSQLLLNHEIDIVGVQEVRVSQKFGNQLDYLLNHMTPNYKYVYRKAMNVKFPNEKSGDEEGLGIITKHEILNTSILQQPSRGKNWNDRLVMNSNIMLNNGYSVSFINTHQGIDPVEQCRQMMGVSKFVDSSYLETDIPQIFVGDFNTYFDFEYPVTILTESDYSDIKFKASKNPNCNTKCQFDKFNKCQIEISKFRRKYDAFKDVWQLLHPNENGFTFTNYQDQDMSRPDRILFRSSTLCKLIPISAKVIGDEIIGKDKTKPLFISDHRIVISTFKMQCF